MATIPEALAIAIEHHQAGRVQVAETIYRQILEVDPRHVDANHLMGVLAGQTGNHALAAEYIAQAIAIDPNQADFHVNLAEAYRALRKFPEAIACCRRALELMPENDAAHHNLGCALRDNGQLDEAVACYRRAVELNPRFAEAHFNLGNALKEQGQFAEAAACFRRVIELEPGKPAAHNGLGIALKKQGQLVEATACFRRAVQLDPKFAEAFFNLGTALQNQGQAQAAEAIACFQWTLELEPGSAPAHNNLGNVLSNQGRVADAIPCYRRVVQLQPNFAGAYTNLGNALRDQGNLTEAIACCQRAIQLQPDLVEAHNNLGCAFITHSQLDEAMACFRQALQLKPDYVASQDNVLYLLHYQSDVTQAKLAEAHREYERQHAAPLHSTWQPHDNVRDPNRRLRLGFLSPDFHQHPVGFLLIRILENLDRNQYEIVCYNDHTLHDQLTARFQAVTALWHDVAVQSDERLAEQIRADQIDILFDLAGHTATNRLLVFARKPAPVQITWIGYEGTTGLEAMDYLLADRYVAPEGEEPHYREKVVRMPDGYVCYDPPASAPPISPLPALEKEYITFGSFNNLAKIGPKVVAVWSEILRRVPESRLVLKYRGLGDEGVRRRYLDQFATAAIEPHRLELLPHSSYTEYLAAYGQLDIALDPFPFSGSATTCETLWMGVPVITCPGETFASRHSLSHLSNIGLLETIASSLDDYIERAVSLAGDLPRLAALRAGLRERMAASPLCDGKRFAANLMPLLRNVWRQWVEAGPQSLSTQSLVANP